jgi:hypothetical protein
VCCYTQRRYEEGKIKNNFKTTTTIITTTTTSSTTTSTAATTKKKTCHQEGSRNYDLTSFYLVSPMWLIHLLM